MVRRSLQPPPPPRPRQSTFRSRLNGGSATAPPVLEQVARDKQEAERAAIVGVLKSTNWNRKQASKLLQIDYKALLYRMKRLSIKKEKKVPQPIQARAEAPSASAESMSPMQVSEPVIARRAIGMSLRLEFFQIVVTQPQNFFSLSQIWGKAGLMRQPRMNICYPCSSVL